MASLPMRTAPPKPVPKPGQVKVVRALYRYDAQQVDELSFDEGDLLYILDMSDKDWWKASCGNNSGLIPSNYVQESTETVTNPLHEAAKRGNQDFLMECLRNGVSVNGLDKAGSTPLHWACHGGHVECVKMLLDQDMCEINVQSKLGDTPLHCAAWKGYSEIVELLLEKGARTDIRNIDNKLPSDLANDPQTASLLLLSAGQHRADDEDYCDDSD